jgi:predicted PurR-regulated permease PerM
MPSGKEMKMKTSRIQRKILIVLLILCILAPVGILLPVFFNAGDAWGEWSAQTLKDMTGYVPQGLAKYSDVWKAPIPDYTLSSKDPSLVHQSGYYIVSGIFGATLTYLLMLLISRLIVKNGK